jgi:cytochrome c biogenesis protein
MKSSFDKIYDALRSIKLASVLLVLLALFAVAGGILPQGKTADFYQLHFPGAGSGIILALGLDHVFSSLLFLLVAAIFAVNLTVCTFHRLTGEFSKPRGKRRHGPDILHLGLIILMFGGILTARTRTETLINLRKGESADLPDGAKIVLVDLNYEQYPDGRPKSWESTVAIHKGVAAQGAPAATSGGLPRYHVKVNAPLRRKGYSIYQQSWHTEKQVVLKDAMGMSFALEPGMREATKDGFVLFMALDNPSLTTAAATSDTLPQSAVFLLEEHGKRTVVKVAPGQGIGPFIFDGYIDQSISGLAVVSDRGYPFVEAGFILVILGIFITYIRKLKGMLA